MAYWGGFCGLCTLVIDLACEPFDWLIGGVFLGLCTWARALTCEPLIGLLGLSYLVYAFDLTRSASFILYIC